MNNLFLEYAIDEDDIMHEASDIEIISSYLNQYDSPDYIKSSKIDKYKNNEDIAKEFRYWIDNKKYMTKNCVNVDGYTAKKISNHSELLDGEGAFSMLIELREDPKKAKKKLSRHVYIK